jgi:hypothetical protein
MLGGIGGTPVGGGSTGTSWAMVAVAGMAKE